MAIRSIANGTGKVRHPGRIVTSGGGTINPNAFVVSLNHWDGANAAVAPFPDELGFNWSSWGFSALSSTEKKFGATSVNPQYGAYAADAAYFDFGSADSTIEGFFYPLALQNPFGNLQVIICKGWQVGAFVPLFVYLNTNGKLSTAYSLDGSTYGVFMTSTGLATAGAWNHFATVRSGTTFYLFLNGVLEGTTTGISGPVMTNTRPVTIGDADFGLSNSTVYFLNGYVDETRLQKGNAQYTASFTPPTAPFTYP